MSWAWMAVAAALLASCGQQPDPAAKAPAAAPAGPNPADASYADALRKRIAELDTFLPAEVCADPATAARLLTPVARPAGAAPPAGTPGAAAQPVNLPEVGGTPLGRQQMVDLVRGVAALVIAPEGKATSTGTGFFVGPDLLMTNKHVVQNAVEGRVYVVNAGLGGVIEGRVAAMSSGPPSPTGDFALVRLNGGRAPGVVSFAPEPAELQDVIAAGYPAAVVQNSANFRRLMQGDASAIPELVYSDGRVRTVQNRQSATPLIVHTASISSGNSGGPLLDKCGRVVGINSFGGVDPASGQVPDGAGVALGAKGAQAFLAQANVRVSKAGTGCAD